MTSARTLDPAGGRRIRGGGVDATEKVTMSDGAFTSTFEVVVPPGYDVGAHVHRNGQEIFYVLAGELDVLAFEPVSRTADWHDWQSATGERYLRGGPGALMWVPPGIPHAFANRTDQPVRMFFQSSAPGGRENYFDELAAILRDTDGPPDPAVIASLRERYDIEQITGLADGR
jgi:oxalate decarboxylase/phosphoglucose isomerase-like protein (cupin superfamily)